MEENRDTRNCSFGPENDATLHIGMIRDDTSEVGLDDKDDRRYPLGMNRYARGYVGLFTAAKKTFFIRLMGVIAFCFSFCVFC